MAPPLLWLLLASLALVLVVLGADTDGLLLVLGLSGLVLVLATSLALALPTLAQLCLFVGLAGSLYWLLRRCVLQPGSPGHCAVGLGGSGRGDRPI
jgi:membrane protein implicated in regulation of membrane protease activity